MHLEYGQRESFEVWAVHAWFGKPVTVSSPSSGRLTIYFPYPRPQYEHVLGAGMLDLLVAAYNHILNRLEPRHQIPCGIYG